MRDFIDNIIYDNCGKMTFVLMKATNGRHIERDDAEMGWGAVEMSGLSILSIYKLCVAYLDTSIAYANDARILYQVVADMIGPMRV